MTRRAKASRSGKAPSQRQLRVGEEVRHVLARLLVRSEFRDPALAGQSITVTEVRVSPDMHNATAFVTPLGGDAGVVLPALNKVAGYLRGQLARELQLRHVPAIAFVYDTSFDQAARIDSMLHNPAVVEDVAATPDDTVDGDPADDDRADDGQADDDGA